jgi:hypothetical protein
VLEQLTCVPRDACKAATTIAEVKTESLPKISTFDHSLPSGDVPSP